MNILVTGATRFLGRHLVKALLADGHSVTATGRNTEVALSLIELGAKFIAADLSNDRYIPCLCAQQQAVVHCAEKSSTWGDYFDFYKINVAATKSLLSASVDAGVQRFIHVSTPSLYFNFRDEFAITEQHCLPEKPANHYIATKRIAELLVHQAADCGLSAITLRPQCLFGPGEKVIPGRLKNLRDGDAISLIDNGVALTDITYVENVVHAIQLALSADRRYSGKVYNITNNESVSLKELLKQFFTAMNWSFVPKNISYRFAYNKALGQELLANFMSGRPEPKLTRYLVGILGKSQTLDISRAQEDLGYMPKVSLADGIQRYAAWLNTV